MFRAGSWRQFSKTPAVLSAAKDAQRDATNSYSVALGGWGRVNLGGTLVKGASGAYSCVLRTRRDEHLEQATCPEVRSAHRRHGLAARTNADIVKAPIRWEDGHIIPPTAQGLRVKLNEEVVAAPVPAKRRNE